MDEVYAKGKRCASFKCMGGTGIIEHGDDHVLCLLCSFGVADWEPLRAAMQDCEEPCVVVRQRYGQLKVKEGLA